MGPGSVSTAYVRARKKKQANKDRKEKQTKERPCDKCRKWFRPEGPHNWLCDTCRQKSFYDGRS